MSETAVINQKPPPPSADVIERALGKGDLSQLTAEQRMEYLRCVCESLGLNPLTRPFDFIAGDKGKVMLYARADAARQLARIHAVTLEIVSKEESHDLYVVHVRGTLPATKGGHKRTDEDVGVVSLQGKKGDDRANAIMKAITKAKRRVTLSICGLGLLDESEVESVPAMRQVEARTTQPQPAALPAPQPAGPSPITNAQLDVIVSQKAALGLTGEAWKAKLATWGVTSAKQMTTDQAAELLRDLQTMLTINGHGGQPNGAGFPAGASNADPVPF